MSIKQRRLDKGWSQEQLAQQSGLSTRTIQRIEGGQKAGLESLKCLAAVFEISVSELMQEHNMTEQTSSEHTKHPLIHDIEREAIEFAQSIIHGANKGEKDVLTKIERDAINYAKNLINKFTIKSSS